MSLEIKGGILRKYRDDEPGVTFRTACLPSMNTRFGEPMCIMCRSLTA